jgi:Ca-activated chloride channel family protein
MQPGANRSVGVLLAAVLSLSICLGLTVTAGQRAAFRGGVDLVSLNVTVTGPGGKYVSDLSADDFTVFEDGAKQDVSFFTRADTPLAVSILLDSSGSMRAQLPLAQRAASDFVARLRPDDVAQVVDFDRSVQILQPFTADQDALERAIRRVRPSGSTSIYNAIYIALQELGSLGAPDGDQIRRDVVVVLSDGEDTSSLVTFDHVLDSAKRSQSVIYTIGLGLSGGGSRTRYRDENPEYALRVLAQETGGRLFLARNASSLSGVYHEIADELASQYVLGYVSNSTQNTGWRRIGVQVGRPSMQARTRTGYYANRQRTQ